MCIPSIKFPIITYGVHSNLGGLLINSTALLGIQRFCTDQRLVIFMSIIQNSSTIKNYVLTDADFYAHACKLVNKGSAL